LPVQNSCLHGIRVAGGQLFGPPNDPLDVQPVGAVGFFERPLHARDRMRGQQLQHPYELTHSVTRPVTFFQTRPKLLEDRRQLPVAIHVRVVQRRRATAQ
jgi:hypothetical protein